MMQRGKRQRYAVLGWDPQSRLGFALLAVLALAVVLVVPCTRGKGASAAIVEYQLPAESRQASVILDESEHAVFLPSVMGAQPLTGQERYGFVALSTNWRQELDVERLGAGWYVDPTLPACATSPGGMDRALLIRVKTWKDYPRLPWLQSMVDRHPGSMWLVGNEPDCVWQDNLLPEDYADIYHEIYWAIKSRDPSASVSPGGIVQPTPLRLQWLQRVLDRYKSQYGGLLPVDAWNIHNQILQEKAGEWGADIPPGIAATEGVIRDPWDNYRVDIFREQIWAFRAWMASKGYAGHPLIVSEFGILMPEGWWGYDADDVNAFMDATFEFLRAATSSDPHTLGDPTDGYHLVQRWAWYSLDDIPYDPVLNMGFNGNLFDPYTAVITGYGLNYSAHTASLSPQSYVELRPGNIWPELVGPVEPGELITRKVKVEVQNLGNLAAGGFVVRLAYYNDLTSEQIELPVPGLATGSSAWLEFDLAGLSPGVYTLIVSVDANESVYEATECDNQVTSIMVVPVDVMYLPLAARRH